MKRSGHHSRAGVTLMELIVCVTIVVILMAAVTRAFVSALDAERAFNRRQAESSAQATFERTITRQIQGAILSENATDTTTYFVGEDGNQGTYTQSTTSTATGTNPSGSNTTTVANPNSGSSGGNTTSSGTDLGCARLTFTSSMPDVPLAVMSNTDDFETQQQTYGPIGGVSEISISTTAVGDAGDRVGLFERVQRPSDGDATQGGMESQLSDRVSSMGFQFWDGTEWEDTWDSTTTPDTKRLPSAVLVSYTLKGDLNETVYQFLVSIPASNVTTDNPIAETSTGATSTSTTGGGGAGR